MNECCEKMEPEYCCCKKVKPQHSCKKGGCEFDTDMILWVLIIIVIVSCMCN